MIAWILALPCAVWTPDARSIGQAINSGTAPHAVEAATWRVSCRVDF